MIEQDAHVSVDADQVLLAECVNLVGGQIGGGVVAQEIGIVGVAVGDFRHTDVVGRCAPLLFHQVGQRVEAGQDGFLNGLCGGFKQSLFVGGGDVVQRV